MMRIFLLTLIILAVLTSGTTISWLGYRLFTTGFSARTEPHPVEVFLARQIRHLAVPIAQRNMLNPLPLNPDLLAVGLAHFADHCAGCHANDGSGQTPIGKMLYPKAPDLRLSETQLMSDGEIFWTIHNGVRFTAMPAWGESDPTQDMDSWKLVHFIRHLPQLTPEELEQMEKLNPKTQKDREKETVYDQFLQGNDMVGARISTSHH